MNFTYVNRKLIARITLMAMVILLLFAFNLDTWSGLNRTGYLDQIVNNQTKELEHCIISNISNQFILRETVVFKPNLFPVFLAFAFFWLFLCFTRIILIKYSKVINPITFTLVSLCVRMDH